MKLEFVCWKNSAQRLAYTARTMHTDTTRINIILFTINRVTTHKIHNSKVASPKSRIWDIWTSRPQVFTPPRHTFPRWPLACSTCPAAHSWRSPPPPRQARLAHGRLRPAAVPRNIASASWKPMAKQKAKPNSKWDQTWSNMIKLQKWWTSSTVCRLPWICVLQTKDSVPFAKPVRSVPWSASLWKQAAGASDSTSPHPTLSWPPWVCWHEPPATRPEMFSPSRAWWNQNRFLSPKISYGLLL